jgi:hypothetical protein
MLKAEWGRIGPVLRRAKKKRRPFPKTVASFLPLFPDFLPPVSAAVGRSAT